MNGEDPQMEGVVRTQPDVVIGMPTYRRPDGLARILPLLLAQARALRGARAWVVIVDNDPDAGARDQVAELAADDLVYLHEPRPGIAAARNCALDAAADADALVCIDDDEEPEDTWLQALVDAWREWGCAAVTGPVHNIFEGDADPWVRGSGVFTDRVRETGAQVPGVGTGNLLLDVAALARHGIRFDERFGLSGGSDTMLSHTLRSKGEVVRWCQEALAWEYVPARRSQRSWVIARTVRTSNTWSRMRLGLTDRGVARFRTRVELTARGLLRLGRGGIRRARARGDVTEDALGTVEMASGRGLLLGAYGAVRYEYGRVRVPAPETT